MTTFQTCVALAEQAGFSPYNAGRACTIASNESGFGADQRCACAYTDGGTIYHDAECDARGLTKHCGVLQLDNTNPLFQPVLSSGCGFDLACSMRALFDLSRGGACFDQPNPWGPDTGQSYGGCAGQVSPATLAASPGPPPAGGSAPPMASPLQGSGQQPCTGDPRTWIDCNIQLPGTGGANDPIGALGAIGDFLHNLSSPNLWTRVGIVIAGTLAIAIGLFALTKEEGGGRQNVTLQLPQGIDRTSVFKQSGSIRRG